MLWFSKAAPSSSLFYTARKCRILKLCVKVRSCFSPPYSRGPGPAPLPPRALPAPHKGPHLPVGGQARDHTAGKKSWNGAGTFLLIILFHRFSPIGQCNANNSYFLKKEHRKNDLKGKKGGNYYLMCWFYMSSILGFFFQGAFVMLRTGWSEFFDQPDKFLGNFEGQNRRVYPGEEYSFNFPSKGGLQCHVPIQNFRSRGSRYSQHSLPHAFPEKRLGKVINISFPSKQKNLPPLSADTPRRKKGIFPFSF